MNQRIRNLFFFAIALLEPCRLAAAESATRIHLTARVISASEVAYGVRNDGYYDGILGFMSCSSFVGWSTDNPNVKIVPPPGFRGCDKNVCRRTVINSKQTVNGELSFALAKGTKLPLSFRLRYKGCAENEKQKREFITDEIASKPTWLNP